MGVKPLFEFEGEVGFGEVEELLGAGVAKEAPTVNGTVTELPLNP